MEKINALQNALDHFQTEYNGYLELTEKILPGQPKEVQDFIESMLESLTLYNLSINRIKTDLSVFKVEYDSQLHVPRFSICMSAEEYDRLVHVSRKHLEDISKTPDFWYAENLDGIMSRFDLHSASGIRPSEFLIYFIEKELLGGSEPHFLTVREAREKLKEGQQ